MSGFDFRAYLDSERKKIDKCIDGLIAQWSAGNGAKQGVFDEPMAYSLTAGGKRVRPVLAISVFNALSGAEKRAAETHYLAALSLEMLHTYTLIHDDLPVMDNDDFRRGKPTCHRKFGNRTATLAGIALLQRSFATLEWALIDLGFTTDERSRIIASLAAAIGGAGVVGGQVADLENEGRPHDRKVLEYIHSHKTGALLMASCALGADLAGADDRIRGAVVEYGAGIGLAFQIVDDLLDVTGDFDAVGKGLGTDQVRGKLTFPALYGIERSREMASSAVKEAKIALEEIGLGRNAELNGMADFILARSN